MFSEIAYSLESCTLFAEIAQSGALKALRAFYTAYSKNNFKREELAALYCEAYRELAAGGFSSLRDYIDDRLRYTESLYSRLAAQGRAKSAQDEAAQRDLAAFSGLCSLMSAGYAKVLEDSTLPLWGDDPRSFSLKEYKDFYIENGSGLFAKSKSLIWENGELIAARNPDRISFEDMAGYTRERGEVISVTRAFLSGLRISNVLLYGDAGAGKTATVKALVNSPEFSRLRLIEVGQNSARDIKKLISRLPDGNLKFIIFLDDISFEDNEDEYAALKAVLDGGVSERPQNVAVYATSNRRRLVREYLSDRRGLLSSDSNEELKARETQQEKLSLSERFGVKIAFLSMEQEEYFELARFLARRRGILDIDEQTLRSRAVEEEITSGVRTPRTARHLIDKLLAEKARLNR